MYPLHSENTELKAKVGVGYVNWSYISLFSRYVLFYFLCPLYP
jgi:hypothetical protein